MKNAWRRQAFCFVSALMAFHYLPGQVQTLQECMEEFAKPSQASVSRTITSVTSNPVQLPATRTGAPND